MEMYATIYFVEMEADGKMPQVEYQAEIGTDPDHVYAENNDPGIIYFEGFCHHSDVVEGMYISKKTALKLIAELSRCLTEE